MLSSVNGAVMVPAQGRPLLSRAVRDLRRRRGDVAGVGRWRRLQDCHRTAWRAARWPRPGSILQQEAARKCSLRHPRFHLPDRLACYACRAGGQYPTSKMSCLSVYDCNYISVTQTILVFAKIDYADLWAYRRSAHGTAFGLGRRSPAANNFAEEHAMSDDHHKHTVHSTYFVLGQAADHRSRLAGRNSSTPASAICRVTWGSCPSVSATAPSTRPATSTTPNSTSAMDMDVRELAAYLGLFLTIPGTRPS